jgi:DNA-binding response OmpR family regulator
MEWRNNITPEVVARGIDKRVNRWYNEFEKNKKTILKKVLMKQILIVDDDEHIGNLMSEVLQKAGYKTSRAYSGTEALLLLTNTKPDLVLLDLMLPGLSGEEIIGKIKSIPIIVVSAKTDIDEKAQLLIDGASDYITKPFAIKELCARVAVALRNNAVTVSNIFATADLRFDTDLREVSANNKCVNLTRTEAAILKILMQNSSQVIAKSVILDRISVDTPDCTDSSLKTHVSNLRKKLRELTGKDYIEAIWGIGFRFSE